MKQAFLFLFTVLLFYSCSSDELVTPVANNVNSAPVSKYRSYDEALKIAESSIDMLEGSSSTRSTSYGRKINSNEVKILTSNTTRSTNFENDTLLYVFNFEDNQGFAVVAAPRTAEALIAVTEKGYYDPALETEVEGFNSYMSLAREYIASSESQLRTKVINIDPRIEQIDTIFYTHVYYGPYLNTQWGQNLPEGELCPNGIAGCSITAMAQVMSYYEYPTTIVLTYEGADISQQVLSWTDMKTHATGHAVSNCTTVDTHMSISRLCRQLGQLANSDYSNPNATSTTTSNVKSTIELLGYQTMGWAEYPYLSGSLRTALQNGKIALMRGTSTAGGHMWVLDGYSITTRYEEVWRRNFGLDFWWVYSSTSTTYESLHYNWGWNGYYNGYFSPFVYDATGNPDGSGNFSQNVQAMIVYL